MCGLGKGGGGRRMGQGTTGLIFRQQASMPARDRSAMCACMVVGVMHSMCVVRGSAVSQREERLASVVVVCAAVCCASMRAYTCISWGGH